jgi:hypothetical protein
VSGEAFLVLAIPRTADTPLTPEKVYIPIAFASSTLVPLATRSGLQPVS